MLSREKSMHFSGGRLGHKCRRGDAVKALLLTFFFPLLSFSQEAIGLNRPSLRWKQFKTETGLYIFPSGMDSIAFRAAAIIGYQARNESCVYSGRKNLRLPVIIQSQSTLPQGFAMPAPWRAELFTIPPQNMFLGPVPWFEALIAHEFRHAQQFWAAKRGFTRVYEVLMGETGWLFHSLLSQPLWYREGDAVTAETSLTNGGRGNLPSFNMEYKALLASGRKYGYEKGTWVSYRDFVPNPYRIGHYMVEHARRSFGEDVWANVLKDTYTRKGFFWIFARALKQETGMKPQMLYQTVVDSMRSEINDELNSSDTTAYILANLPVKTFTSYRYPQWLPDGNIVAEVSGFDRIRSIVRIDSSGKVKKIFRPGIYTTDHNSFAAGSKFLGWAESSFDPRWKNRDYSVISVWDIDRRIKKWITMNSRLFSPAFSPDGEKLVCVSHSVAGKVSLQVWNVSGIKDRWDRKISSEFDSPGNDYLAHPRWMDSGKGIIVIAQDEHGNAILRIDNENGKADTLLHFSHVMVSRPFPVGDTIYFSGGLGGTNEIFALDIGAKNVFQLTKSDFGAFEPVVSRDRKILMYSAYTAMGYQIRKCKLAECAWKSITWPQSDPPSALDTLKSDSFPVKKFHPLTRGLFRITGWIPLPNIIEYGAELYTKNIMSNLTGTAGALWNVNEDALRGYCRFSYAGIYPVFDLEGTWGERRIYSAAPPWAYYWPLEFSEIRLTERTLGAWIRLPLNFSRGPAEIKVEPRFGLRLYDVRPSADTDDWWNPVPYQFIASEFSLSYSKVQPSARKFTRPRWGHELNLTRKTSYPSNLAFASYEQADGKLYFPGFCRTHSLLISGGYVNYGYDGYRFVDKFRHPRGYNQTIAIEESRLSAEYQIPVWYPDIAFGGWAFLQRLRMNVFYDHGQGGPGQMRSAGAELLLDTRIFRLFKAEMGLRCSYLMDPPAGSNLIRFGFFVNQFEFAN